MQQYKLTLHYMEKSFSPKPDKWHSHVQQQLPLKCLWNWQVIYINVNKILIDTSLLV